MRFYRLEKENYFKKWSFAILKSLLISIMLMIILMLVMGYEFMIVVSSSMEPTLPVGSLVLITPCEYEDLENGDIVTMDKNGINLTHRVVGKGSMTKDGVVYYEEDDPRYESAVWCTKGDNSDTHDGEITDPVIGIVYEEHSSEFLGAMVRYIKNNKTIVIIYVVLFVVCYEVANWLKGKMTLEDIECYDWEEE